MSEAKENIKVIESGGVKMYDTSILPEKLNKILINLSVSFSFLAISTAFGFYLLSYHQLSKFGVNPLACIVASIIVGVLMSCLNEGTLSEDFQEIFKGENITESDKWSAYGRLFISFGFTLFSVYMFSESVSHGGGHHMIEAETVRQDSIYQERIAPFKIRVEKALDVLNKKERQRSEAIALERLHADPNVMKQYGKEGSWTMNASETKKYRQSIKDVTALHDSRVRRAENSYNLALESLEKEMFKADTAKSSALAYVSGVANEKDANANKLGWVVFLVGLSSDIFAAGYGLLYSMNASKYVVSGVGAFPVFNIVNWIFTCFIMILSPFKDWIDFLIAMFNGSSTIAQNEMKSKKWFHKTAVGVVDNVTDTKKIAAEVKAEQDTDLTIKKEEKPRQAKEVKLKKKCKNCNKAIKGGTTRKKYCSDACRKAYYDANKRPQSDGKASEVPSGKRRSFVGNIFKSKVS